MMAPAPRLRILSAPEEQACAVVDPRYDPGVLRAALGEIARLRCCGNELVRGRRVCGHCVARDVLDGREV